jgi:hypothetical protein
MSWFKKKDAPHSIIIPLSDTLAPTLFQRKGGELSWNFSNQVSRIIHILYKELPEKQKKEHKYYTFYCYSGVFNENTRERMPGITAFRQLWIRSRNTRGFPSYIYDFNIRGIWDNSGPRLVFEILNGGPNWPTHMEEGKEPEWNPPQYILEIMKAFPGNLEEYLTSQGDPNVATRMAMKSPEQVRANIETTKQVLSKLHTLPQVLEDEILNMIPRQSRIPPNTAIALSQITTKKRRRTKRRKTRKN